MNGWTVGLIIYGIVGILTIVIHVKRFMLEKELTRWQVVLITLFMPHAIITLFILFSICIVEVIKDTDWQDIKDWFNEEI